MGSGVTGVTGVGVGATTRGAAGCRVGALCGARCGGAWGLGHVTTLTVEHTVVVFLAPFLGCLTGTVLQTRFFVVLHADFSVKDRTPLSEPGS